MNTKAIVLFGHGARDIRWRESFDCFAALWKAQHPNVLVELAFLELMQPSLEEAIGSLVTAGAAEVVVVPVFLVKGAICAMTFQHFYLRARKSFLR